MTKETDRPLADQETVSASAPLFAAPASTKHKPRLAIFVATAAGLGYLPKAPGTWGSLAGILFAILPWWLFVAVGLVSENEHFVSAGSPGSTYDPLFGAQVWIALTVGAIGVWASDRSSKFWNQKDPQRVVIDEVSGQHLALFLGCAVPLWWKTPTPWPEVGLGFITVETALNWKYLLLGFILFRVFDIWKPFPARQAESLPGGWGIMADDWIAGIYAGLGLWVARALGL
jgi:phosphatidylglycerophosphatase A